MVPSLPLLSCKSSVSVKENPEKKKHFLPQILFWTAGSLWLLLTISFIRTEHLVPLTPAICLKWLKLELPCCLSKAFWLQIKQELQLVYDTPIVKTLASSWELRFCQILISWKIFLPTPTCNLYISRAYVWWYFDHTFVLWNKYLMSLFLILFKMDLLGAAHWWRQT